MPTSDFLQSTSFNIRLSISGTSVDTPETNAPAFIWLRKSCNPMVFGFAFCCKNMFIPSVDEAKSENTDQTSDLKIVGLLERKNPFILPDTST